jgi:hypothetical protein
MTKGSGIQDMSGICMRTELYIFLSTHFEFLLRKYIVTFPSRDEYVH